MESLFFAKLFGLYFIIIGVIMLIRRRTMMPTVTELTSNRALLLLIAVIELAAGIALALAYPVVSLSLEGALSLIGYMMIIEGIIYLAMPLAMVRRFVAAFNRPVFYVAGGLLCVAAGVYLANLGFGFM